MLAVGLCCAKDSCVLVEKNTYEIVYDKLTIMCNEPNFGDSVKYEVHLELNQIDQITQTIYRNDWKYVDMFTTVLDGTNEQFCLISRDTTDEYGVIIGRNEYGRQTEICKRRFRYVWNRLKKLGTYK